MLDRKNIKIPRGRRVKFHPFRVSYKNASALSMYNSATSENGTKEYGDFGSLTFMLTNELTFSVSADYSKAINTSINPLRSLLQDGVDALAQALLGAENGGWFSGLVGGEFKKLGFQTFTGGAPIDLSLTCSVVATTNAKEQVIKPILQLQKLAVPKIVGSEGDAGSFVFPGQSVFANDEGADSIHDALNDADYIVTVGNFIFDHILVKRVTPTFSNIVDDEGWPVSAEVQIDISTMYIAYDKMLDRIYDMNSENTGFAGGGLSGGGGGSF